MQSEIILDEGAGYNYAYLDEASKRMIRRSILKAVAVPGYQVPFGSREMPIPPGWGTGGMQVTASIIGSRDRLKVIDQGADDTANAVSIRQFFRQVSDVATTERTTDATVIQTRHRIPEDPLTEEQIIVFQVPNPEPLRRLVVQEALTKKMHSFARYGAMYVHLYEDIARHGGVSIVTDYPVMVNGRYLASPSPIPKFDNPKLNRSRALALFGAGRERRIHAIPPFTDVKSLDFADHPFTVQRWNECCSLCGAADSYLDEVLLDDNGTRAFVCSDTSYCTDRRERNQR